MYFDPNLNIKEFTYKGFFFRATEKIIVHYRGEDKSFMKFNFLKYGCDCYLIDEENYKFFPFQTRAVYVYDEYKENETLFKDFKLHIHPCEIIVLEENGYHKAIDLNPNESFGDYMGNRYKEFNFVTIFLEDS
jgi:hypothetical protein